jgi:MraZ protein
MESPRQPVGSAQPPLGLYTSRVDEKGRLKLPKDIEEYLKHFAEQGFFVTSLDGDIARIYPMDVWRENLRVLENEQEDPERADRIAYAADYFGAIAAIDNQGRILIPPVLRRRIGIENQPVHVRYSRGAYEVQAEPASDRRMQEAEGSLKPDVVALRKKGLK